MFSAILLPVLCYTSHSGAAWKPVHMHGKKLTHSEVLKCCASHNPMWYVPT